MFISTAHNLLKRIVEGRNMTMQEFQVLPREEQVPILYQNGVYIGKKKTDELIRLLFQLESFYVEIIYINYRKFIYKIRCTNSTCILEPYLNQIDVKCLAI